MASSHSFVRVTSPEEGNWLSLGRALTTVLCQGIRPYIQREMAIFYTNVTVATTALPVKPCTCVYDPTRKKNHYHDMSTCVWAQILQGFHLGNKPNWKQSDPIKWMDPNIGPWEITKLFLPDVGGHTVIESAEDMDITALLNLMFWCKHFTVQQALIKDVRETRNTKWVHVPKLALSDAEKRASFETIEKLLKDPVFVGDPDAQGALQDVLALKCTSDVHIFKAEVLSQFKEAIRSDVSSLKSELRSLKKESKRNEKQRSRIEGRLHNMQKALEKVEKKSAITASSLTFVFVLSKVVITFLIKGGRCMRRKSLAAWLTVWLLCCFVGILDHRSYRDGCPTEDISVPFDTKEFNLTDYLTIARENFIGRRWLYQEIEVAFYPARQGVSGVLIIGDPGAGKSALSAQLVCSRTSSRAIHDHVLGYHLCRHSDKNTQNGGKFVRNLAEMIARRLPEYGYIVANNSYIQRSLNSDCVTIQDPVGCFEQAILTPLRSLKHEPEDNWYIVIDALDECLTQSETSHSIVYLLNNKLPRFPSWLKLVMTSRNESTVSLKSNNVMKLIIDPEDTRNMEDIELFLSTKFYQDGSFIHQIKLWFGDNTLKTTARLISALLSKSQGNFLFVKEMLHHWETSRAGANDPYALPETLGELYQSYFERLYSRREQFHPIRRVLELLVATFQPLTQKEIFEVLRIKEVNLEEDYDFKDRMKELGHFLRYGENDTVSLYHLSLTEWLTSESNKNGPFYVSKKKGHEVFCDFYFTLIAEGDKNSLSKYILPLAQHITYGGWRESYVKEFLRFPSQVVNSSDPKSNRNLLHLAATINSTDVLELLLRHFSCIDCIDNHGITPAFLAAEHGLVHNLALMVKRGAKVNRKTNSLSASYKSEEDESSEFDNTDYMYTPVLQSKSKFWSSTMLHAAAHRGHFEVVAFLLDNGAFISTVDGVNLTALQIAAENGHLRVVKALYEAGAIADQTALHHAAANNRLEVVKYLLQIGVTDKCMRCDGSFYWLKTSKHRLQSRLKAKRLMSINKQCLLDIKHTLKGKNCIEEENITNTEFGELFDDKHLIFCETALHAAVKAGHKAIVKELIFRGARALRCRDYTGRTPLHEAVRKNDSEIVKLMLKKDHTMMHKTCNHWQIVKEHNEKKISLTLSVEENIEYHRDICHCGYTPLHLAARYGYWRIGLDLIIAGAYVEARDCFGATPLHVAACHNHRDFVDLLTLSNIAANVNTRSSNGSNPVHSAAACGAVEVIDHLLYHGANLSAVDNDGLLALHYAILQIHPNQLDQNIIFNRTDLGGVLHVLKIDRRGHLTRFYKSDSLVKNGDRYQWLDVFVTLILRGSDIEAVDKQGRTPLHLAAANGLADAVNVLLEKKAKFEIRDKLGKTPLDVAVENSTEGSKNSPLIFESSFHDFRQHLRDHEMVVYLLLSSGASFKKCNGSGASLLHRAISKRKPYIVQLLLLKGARLNCKNNLAKTTLLAFIRIGGDWANFPFKHSNDSVTIKFGKTLNSSEFPLLCYFPPKLGDNNFFELVTCDDQNCSKKSPIIRAIESHRLRHKVIDSCLDAEGFTPLHRAAQAGNLVVVRNLIKHRANLSLLSPQGHDALTLAILHAGGNMWQHPVVARKDNVSVVALELLHHAMETRGFQIVCDSTKPELTLYHLAASRGLVKFIQEMFKDQEQHQLDVNCPNSDGVTPMYLAKIFSGKVLNGNYNPWKEVIRIIEDQGGRMLFPSKDVEHNVIYKRLFGWIPNDLELHLRPDVRGFVLGLVSTFQYRQNTSVYCEQKKLNMLKGMQIGYHLSLLSIWKELLLQLKPTESLVMLALRDMKMCGLQVRRSSIYLKKYRLSKTTLGHHWADNSIYRKALKMTSIQLFYLMRMWHQVAFQTFPCIKMMFDKYRPFFVDDKQLKQLITQYQKSTPTWYLGDICFSFEHVFNTYSQHYSSNDSYNELDTLYHNFPDFISKRMGWTVNQLGLQRGSWPFEFLVKFSLGLYRQYDYLKVLNVGLEPKTYISLYSDETREAMRRNIREIKKQFRSLLSGAPKENIVQNH